MILKLGKTCDEDVGIKLTIIIVCLLKSWDLACPGINIIEKSLDLRLLDFVFSIEESAAVVTMVIIR